MSNAEETLKALDTQILANPKFHTLVRRRNRIMWILFGLTLGIFFGYTLILAFAPALLAVRLWPGMVTPLGIPLGMSVVLVSFVFTGIYTWRANRDFDEVTREILAEAQKSVDE